jgi:hypothetical protein
VSPDRGRARNARPPEPPTTPPPPPPAPRAPFPPATAAEAGALALRKAAAFDDLAKWITEESGGAYYTDAMGPEWVVSTIKSRVGSMLEDARDFRAGRRLPTFRRRVGW